MKHKNMKQYEEKNAPMLNHDITLEEIEAACRAHQKENDNRNMAEECRTIAREQKEKMQAQFTKGKGEKRHILLRLGRYLWQFKGWLFLAILLSISSNLLSQPVWLKTPSRIMLIPYFSLATLQRFFKSFSSPNRLSIFS